MTDYSEFVNALKDNIEALAKEILGGYAYMAAGDVKTFLEKARADIERWGKETAEGKLSKDDFEWLLKSKMDSAELIALKNAGLTEAALEKFRQKAADLVVKTALNIFP